MIKLFEDSDGLIRASEKRSGWSGRKSRWIGEISGWSGRKSRWIGERSRWSGRKRRLRGDMRRLSILTLRNDRTMKKEKTGELLS
jgi:hypothetical protein